MHYHIILERFQLTRSRGAWPVAVRKSIHYLKNFNSHAHVERDRRNALHLTSWILFQLTRSRGAWPSFVSIVFHVLKFQLTRSRGAWPVRVLSISFDKVFQLTRSRGAWLTQLLSSIMRDNFNSHAHVERDGYGILKEFTQNSFQLTRSRGAWRNC